MRFKSLILAVLLSTCLAAGARGQEKVEIIPDVVYGHKDGMALTMDVIRPRTNANHAAVIAVISGGWISNYDPPRHAAETPPFKALLDKGFTVIALRHGGSPKYLIPDIVADVRRGVRFIRHNAKQWDIDPDRIGVTGASAGGHLALMIGTASDNGDTGAKVDFMRESDRVASVVAYFPPVDLRPYVRGLNAPNDGSVLDQFPSLNFEKAKAPDYSPLLFVSPDDPPTLLMHGDKDPLVPISNSQSIYEAFRKANVKTEFVTFPGAVHGFRGDDETRSIALMVNWFEQTLLKKATKTR